VANYREVTLANELATGREILRAAGIAGNLPRAVDGVDERAQELLGWVLREGLTNVVRHSNASSCRVTIGPDSVEIVDDGPTPPGGTAVHRTGGESGPGHGLRGLRERVEAAGGWMDAGPVDPQGWRLRAGLNRPAPGRSDAPTSKSGRPAAVDNGAVGAQAGGR
jgi:two-component system sensor histidine kinase DesK